MLTLQYVKTLCEVTVVSPTWSETECHEPWDVTSCQVVVSDGVLFTVKHDYSKHTYNEFMLTVKSYYFPKSENEN